MKILFLSDEFPPHVTGGPGVVVAHLARGFKERGHQVVVVATVRRREDAGTTDYQGIQVVAIYSSYHARYAGFLCLYRPSISRQLEKIFAQIQPDVVHAHNIHYHLTYDSLRLAKKSGARVILTTHDCMLFHYGKFTDFYDRKDVAVHDSYNYRISWQRQLRTFKRRYNPLRNILIRRYLKKFVDVLCTVSDEQKKALEANGITGAVTVHNGLNVAAWKADPIRSRDYVKKFGLENSKVVLFAGRLSEAKGGDQLFAAIQNLYVTQKNIALVLVGQANEYVNQLMSKAAVSGVKVVVTGWIDQNDVPNIYALANVVVFPSICFDTFGMVNIEGMAAGKPVLATCFGGAREVIEEGVSGYIINPFDTDRFAHLLADIVTHPDLEKRLGRAGRERVIKLFDLHRQLDSYEKIYRDRGGTKQGMPCLVPPRHPDSLIEFSAN